MAPSSNGEKALVGTWLLQSGAAEAIVTTTVAERIVRPTGAVGTIEVEGLDRPFQYVEYQQSGVEGIRYEDVFHSLTLRTHPFSVDPIDPGTSFPICTLYLEATERVQSGPGEPPLSPPTLGVVCIEDADYTDSAFELPVETDAEYTFDPVTLSVDLPETRLERTSTSGSVLGDDIAVGGRFQADIFQVPANVPTRIPVELIQTPVFPVGARLTLSSEGTYESSYIDPSSGTGAVVEK